MNPIGPDDLERDRWAVKVNGAKLTLPGVPDADDLLGLRQWISAVFSFGPLHPATGVRNVGERGTNSLLVIARAGAPAIRFEPRSRMMSAAKLIDTLESQLLPSDAAVHPFKAGHINTVAHVVRMLAGATEAGDPRQIAEAMIGSYLLTADRVNGLTTHGTSAQRYEAVVALRRERDTMTGRPMGVPRYLVDTIGGEYVLPVGDFAEHARREKGGSLTEGWLVARLEEIGWERRTLDGYAPSANTPSSNGRRRGPHAHIGIYAGHLTAEDDEVEPANPHDPAPTREHSDDSHAHAYSVRERGFAGSRAENVNYGALRGEPA